MTIAAEDSSLEINALLSGSVNEPQHSKKETTMDRFAEIYVPLWLRQVNEVYPMQRARRSLAERASIDYLQHIEDIFPPSLLRGLLQREAKERLRIQKLLIKIPDVNLAARPVSVSETTLRSAAIIPRKPGSKVEKPVATGSVLGSEKQGIKEEKTTSSLSPSMKSGNSVSVRDSTPPTSPDSSQDLNKRSDSFFEAGRAPKPIKSNQDLYPLAHLPSLNEETYCLHWIPLIITERNARIKQLTSAALYLAQLVPLLRQDPPVKSALSPLSRHLYTMKALSIREGWPPVDIGDLLLLRQLRPSMQSWQGIEFEASVWGINRAAGKLIIRCDALYGREEALLFNVVWMVQDHVFYGWRRAVEMLQLLSKPDFDSNVLRTWLMPTSKHSVGPAALDLLNLDRVRKVKWVDASLNVEQKRAVESILWGKHKVPFLISGPPGSGKTKTIVEAVMQLLAQSEETHILLCGASDPSADTLARRLQRHGLTPHQLFRMNPPSRPFSEVRDELLLFCHVDGEKFKLPDTRTLLSKRVIVTTCLDASILTEARCTNHDLAALEGLIRTSVHPNKADVTLEPHFRYLIVDEAGQASEPDLCCALAVVAIEDDKCSRAHVTLCGDVKQLGPQNTSKDLGSGFDTSLLERLSERGVYRNHPAARRNRKKAEAVKWKLGTPFVDLTKNYRSCLPILMLPSTLFYNETLEPCAAPSIQHSPLHKWKGLVSPGFPIVFRGIEGQDEPVDEGASFWNEAEVDFVRKQVLDLVQGDSDSHGPLKPSEISVIAPFREQVWRIRLALRAERLGEVDVGNVEALQGAENRVVIISTVRSNMRWLARDLEQSRGIIHEPKRFNVAMTRAKELLIVVGNARTLTVDSHWLAFYRLCCRNGCYLGNPIENQDESNGAEAISRLEQEYHTSRGNLDSAFDVLVGSMARQTLDEEENENEGRH